MLTIFATLIVIFLLVKLGIFLYNYFDKNIFILCKESSHNNYILEKLGKKIENYKPTFYLPNFDSMVFIHLSSFESKVKLETIKINSRDKTNIDLDFYGDDFENNPIVIIKYGLNGNSHSKYMRPICKMLKKNNFNSIIVNDRKLNETKNKNKLLGHYDIFDLEDSLDYIVEKYPNNKKFLLGISLGANYLTKFLGETKKDYKIVSACIISNPFDILKTSYYFDKTLKGKIMSKIFWYELKGYLKNDLKLNSNYKEIYNNFRSPLIKIDKVENVFNFDSLIVKRIAGYDSIYDYYEDCQSSSVVKNIKTKTLFINSLNDEISKKEFIPLNDIYNNENCILLLVKNGGHIEYFSGLNAKWWAYELAIDYFNAS